MIGVLGGTFDPVHYGHLRPALEVKQALGLDQVRFVPLRVAAHRPPPQLDARQRFDLLEIALRGQPGFVADARELHREGVSYTVDTLRSLRDEFSPAPLCLLLGLDAFQGFLDWHRPEEILSLANLAVMSRPPSDQNRPAGDARKLLAQREIARADAIHRLPAGGIIQVAVTQLDISATAVRHLLARNQSPRFLLPDAVLDEIDRQRFYV